MSEHWKVENDVLIGREGYLFLAQGGHNVLDVVTGRRPVNENALAVFAENISRRRALARAAGVKYLHIIYPDKQSILTEHYITESPICLGEIAMLKTPDLADQMMYPLDILRKRPKLSYMRCDTHLTDFSSISISADIVEVLTGANQESHRQLLLDKVLISKPHSGDLGSKLTPKRSHDEMFLSLFWPVRWTHNNLSGGNNGLVDLWFGHTALYDKRLLFFGDSFGREACKILSYFFREVIFLRTPYFHDEIFHAAMPDYVVSENVERYLNSCTSDDLRPWFTLYPHLGNATNYQPSREFVSALSAVLSYKRTSYLSFVQMIEPSRDSTVRGAVS